MFLDTAVFMYAGGRDHPLRSPCQVILERVSVGALDATTSAEVVQEILHRFVAVRRPDIGVAMARDVLDACEPVLPITNGVVRRMPDLVVRYPSLTARDLVHVATCIHEGITEIISPDKAFDQVAELRRIDPSEFAVEPA